MTPKNYDKLHMHACDCSQGENPMDWCRSAELREQLVAEIHALEERLSELEDQEARIDFSLRQTCREMIHSRQQLFLKLRR